MCRVEHSKRNGATSVCSLMLRQVVASRELLTTFSTFEWFILCVKRAVVALEVFLTTEATVAKVTDKGFGRVISQGLFRDPWSSPSASSS